jgi:hypothetical protein
VTHPPAGAEHHHLLLGLLHQLLLLLLVVVVVLAWLLLALLLHRLLLALRHQVLLLLDLLLLCESCWRCWQQHLHRHCSQAVPLPGCCGSSGTAGDIFCQEVMQQLPGHKMVPQVFAVVRQLLPEHLLRPARGLDVEKRTRRGGGLGWEGETKGGVGVHRAERGQRNHGIVKGRRGQGRKGRHTAQQSYAWHALNASPSTLVTQDVVKSLLMAQAPAAACCRE